MLKRWGAVMLAPLGVWCFLPGIRELWQLYSSFWLFDNALAAGAIVLVYGIAVWRYGIKRGDWEENFPGLLIVSGILGLSGAMVLNNYVGGFQLVPPMLAYVAMFCWLGFWLKPSFWKKSVFVFMMLILTLPVLERLQRFVGFPLRLVTANIVSFLLQVIGVGTISNSTVIVTENFATTIDLPCSGVKSLYFGGIILLGVYFLQQLKISVKSILLACLFILLLVFFNIWRVFGLVYIYGVLHLQTAGDSIHVLLGVVGFGVSCLALWFGSEYVRKSQSAKPQLSVNADPKWEKTGLAKRFNRENTLKLCAAILIITGIITNTLIKAPAKKAAVFENSSSFANSSLKSSVIPLTDKEATLFVTGDATFVGKYTMEWKQKDLSLLLVKSASARSHHDPELCLQSLGYRLVHEQTVSVSETQVKQIDIQTSGDPGSQKGIVYYWYASKDKTITDYSQRVWEQFHDPKQTWVLIEVLFSKSQEPANTDLAELFDEITTSVREQLL